MTNKAKIEINGHKLTVNLSYTTQGIFVDYKGYYTRCYCGYEYDELLELYAAYLLEMAEKAKAEGY